MVCWTLYEPPAYTVTPVPCWTARPGSAAWSSTGSRGWSSPPPYRAEVMARATVLTAADLAGIAREALTRTVQYDKDRVQFGKAVGSFQALKHSLADLHIAVTMAEHAALYAAYARGHRPRRPRAGRVASPRPRPATPPATSPRR